MKKIISLICAIILTLSINAQTGFKDAVDFNCTDEYGTNVHLFDILDNGQYALLYFFWNDGNNSEIIDPCIAETYYYFGANQDEVFFIGIDPTADSLEIDTWKQKYQVDFPVIHPFTEGTDVHVICEDLYNVVIMPRVMLVAPNRKIVIEDIWPIESTQQLIDEIKDAMDEEYKPTAITELNDNEISVYPNPATSEINITSRLNGEADVRIYDLTGRCVKDIRVYDNSTINISDIDNGVYFIDVNGKVEKLVVE